MPKYIVQLRRGTKEKWANYEKNKPEESIPLAGELVVEYDNGVPRLKIGDGTTKYSSLPYMSVDSFILPTHTTIQLNPNSWISESEKRHYQYVTPTDTAVTSTSKIDLQLTPEQLLTFKEKDVTFTAVNEKGKIRVCVIGQKPADWYTIQVTVTEVMTSDNVIDPGKVIGSTAATPYDIQSLIDRITALENKINNA